MSKSKVTTYLTDLHRIIQHLQPGGIPLSASLLDQASIPLGLEFTAAAAVLNKRRLVFNHPELGPQALKIRTIKLDRGRLARALQDARTKEASLALSQFEFPTQRPSAKTISFEIRRLPSTSTGRLQIAIVSDSQTDTTPAAEHMQSYPYSPLGRTSEEIGGFEEWLEMSKDSSSHEAECRTQVCPKHLQSSIRKLFPACKSPEMATTITVGQRTENCMATWSSEVASEREIALSTFMSLAHLMVGKLTLAGYWADCIDPSSGKAFFGKYTNETFAEADERMRHLGYHIEDLGCCKCLAHPIWGTNVFAGIIVTNAPPDSDILRSLLLTPQSGSR